MQDASRLGLIMKIRKLAKPNKFEHRDLNLNRNCSLVLRSIQPSVDKLHRPSCSIIDVYLQVIHQIVIA